MTKAPAPRPAASPPQKPPGKRIVIFADGTGNAFTTRESNIWRLYQALDKTDATQPLQLVRYIPGVGTSGNTVMRLIDGATGIGVPANVRALYRFLCWNWEEDDEIFLFGFSRGAFTVRTLAAMVAMQGLMPREVGGVRVTGPEMSRNAMAAWLAYRKETAPFATPGTSAWNPLNWQMNPLTALVREVRDGVINIKRDALGQDRHATVGNGLPIGRKPGAVRVRFLGLFDTVEAYGMPVEELTRAWNRLVWPIKFRNQRGSWVVDRVRHALALDDERHSFHPIRFDVSPRPDGKPVPDTQELWFAGMHSDVGGGYPDDEVSFEPLLWLAREAAEAGLVFDDEALARYRKQLYPQAMIHDSRAGLASLYRYAPREIDDAPRHGGAAVIHHSVTAKMDRGANGYAPLTLPPAVEVLAKGTDWADRKGFGKVRVPEVHGPMSRLILQRKGTNWATILSVATLVAIPVWDLVMGVSVVPGRVGEIAAWSLGWALPGWAMVWLQALIAKWWLSLPALLVIWIIRARNRTLGYRIRDRARKLWVVPPPVAAPATGSGLPPPAGGG